MPAPPPAAEEGVAPPRAMLLAAGLAAAVALAALALRPLLPIDETRYVSVAWEMWQRGEFLVPHLNGEEYSHKPPLLFWLIHLGWAALGVSEWWARLVPAFAALGGLALTAHLARLLWPERPAVGPTAAVLLAGTGLWAAFTGALFFDTLLACCVLAALIGLLQSLRSPDSWRGTLLTGVALSLGGLAKGPVVLLHVLPVALLAPWWASGLRRRRWYGRLSLAVLLGIALAMAWAIPAALSGSEAYREAILWGQTASRMVDSVAHKRGWWWYLPLLPALLYPWVLWPSLLARLAALREAAAESGVRFCLGWLLPSFVAFSLVSGKQVHYLLPLLPALALLAARALQNAAPASAAGLALPAAVPALAGIAVLVLPASHLAQKEQWVAQLPGWAGWALLALAGAVPLLARKRPPARQVALLAMASAALVILAQAAFMAAARPAYDLAGLAPRQRQAEREGRPLAHVGKYYGQFHFLGRLERPIEPLERGNAARWMAEHPDGIVLARERDWVPRDATRVWRQDYRGDVMSAWQAGPR